MEILIRNKNGKIEVGGGKHPVANIMEITGLGLPEREFESAVFSGQPGINLLSLRDKERIITISMDFIGSCDDAMNVYSVLQEKCELIFFANGERRRIFGICLNAGEVENIIAKRMYKIVVQFTCEQPYFEDYAKKEINISARYDMFPSYFENGVGIIDLSVTPIPTIRKTSAQISNRGSVEIRPIIQILFEEESDGFTVTNMTSQKSITLHKTIESGEVITIDCESRKINSSIDGSIINYLDEATYMSEFFIAQGENQIEVTNDKNDLLLAKINYRNKYKAVVLI